MPSFIKMPPQDGAIASREIGVNGRTTDSGSLNK